MAGVDEEWWAAAFLWITSLISQGRNLRGRCRLISPVWPSHLREVAPLQFLQKQSKALQPPRPTQYPFTITVISFFFFFFFLLRIWCIDWRIYPTILCCITTCWTWNVFTCLFFHDEASFTLLHCCCWTVPCHSVPASVHHLCVCMPDERCLCLPGGSRDSVAQWEQCVCLVPGDKEPSLISIICFPRWQGQGKREAWWKDLSCRVTLILLRSTHYGSRSQVPSSHRWY